MKKMIQVATVFLFAISFQKAQAQLGIHLASTTTVNATANATRAVNAAVAATSRATVAATHAALATERVAAQSSMAVDHATRRMIRRQNRIAAQAKLQENLHANAGGAEKGMVRADAASQEEASASAAMPMSKVDEGMRVSGEAIQSGETAAATKTAAAGTTADQSVKTTAAKAPKAKLHASASVKTNTTVKAGK